MDHVQDQERTEPDPTETRDRFLQGIARQALLPGHVGAATAATVVVCTLATRLTRGQAHQLLGALPLALQPLFRPCIAHRFGTVVALDDARFLERIADRLHVTPAHAERICDAVFRAVRADLPAAVLDHVTGQLPHDLRDLWSGTRPVPTVALTPLDARHALLTEIAEHAPLPAGVTAVDAFAAVMCIFTQRLSGGEARDVLLGLPDALHPLIARCVRHRDEPGAVFDRDQLLRSVADDLGTAPPLAEWIILAVFAAVQHALPAKEVRDVARQLPADLGALWTAAGR